MEDNKALEEFAQGVNKAHIEQRPYFYVTSSEAISNRIMLAKYDLVYQGKTVRSGEFHYDGVISPGTIIGKSERNRLLVEGVNSDNAIKEISHQFGGAYFRDLIIPHGEVCAYGLEFQVWQGTNGHSDISALTLDYLLFRKNDLVKVLEFAKKTGSAHASFLGERLTDNGFWEDGFPCFTLKHPNDYRFNAEIKISPRPEFNVLEVNKECSHYDDWYVVDSHEIAFFHEK